MAVHNHSIILVTGVSGSGKSTIAAALARRLHLDFLEGDSFHSPHEIEKMKSGHPLTDEDRWPWLERINQAIRQHVAEGRGAVVACSGLRKAYRQHLTANVPDSHLVFLKGLEPVIAARVQRRKGHFMPASLLDSQFAALEEPGPEEHPIVVSVEGSEDETLAAIEKALGAR